VLFARREPGRYLDAAVQVLRAAGRPLTAREIAEEAVARGLICPDGAAPAAAPSSTVLDAQAPRIHRPDRARGRVPADALDPAGGRGGDARLVGRGWGDRRQALSECKGGNIRGGRAGVPTTARPPPIDPRIAATGPRAHDAELTFSRASLAAQLAAASCPASRHAAGDPGRDRSRRESEGWPFAAHKRRSDKARGRAAQPRPPPPCPYILSIRRASDAFLVSLLCRRCIGRAASMRSGA
jgi:hypothetical protein